MTIKNQLSTFYLIIMMLLSSCSNLKTENNSLIQVDIESNINNLKIEYLSQFTDNVNYVPFETQDYFYISANSDCVFSDSLILVYNLNRCALFNSTGKFIARIGTKGNGPGEFQFCVQACFSKHRSIYLQSNLYDLFEYSLDGTFMNKYENIFRIDKSDERFLSNWLIIDDSLFFGHIPNTTGQMEYKSILINKHGEIKQTWKNYDRFPRKSSQFGYEKDAYIYYFEGSIFFKQFYSDTLFCLNGRNELVPKYSFYLGSLKMPIEVRANRFGGKELWSYISLYNVFQTENYLFLKCGFGNRFPAKRLTPQTINSLAGPTMYNTNYMLGIVDKHSGDLSFCKPTNTDNPLFTTGIINDFDAGPRFFPSQIINDSTLSMWVSADELKAHVSSNDFKNNNPLYPEKKIALEELSNRINLMDNPVLMIVTFKK